MTSNLALDDLLREKVEAFTVRPVAGAVADPEQLVLVPPKADIAIGFAQARRLVDEGHAVRLLGYGVTLAQTWPAWVSSTGKLLLTELGAYCFRPPEQCVAELRAGLAQWIDQVFDGVLPVPASKVFFASAAIRVFQPTFDAAPIVAGIVARHPRARFHCTDERWAGLALLEAGLRGSGGAILPKNRRRRRAIGSWSKSVAQAGAAIAVAAALQVRDFFRWAPARAELSRRAAAPRAAPKLWVALMADWPRANAHFMNSFVLPEARRGTPIGAFLLGDLSPGARMESDLRRRTGSELWPGVGELRDPARGCTLEQAVGPSTVSDLVRLIAGSAVASARVASRGFLRLDPLRRAGLPVELAAHGRGLAQLFTIDVFRARAAAAAVRRAAERHDFRGKWVVMTASVLPEHAAADVTLQALGATTVEFYHGAGLDLWVGGTESPSRFRSLFTHADAESVEALGQRCIVAGMPTGRSDGEPRSGPATRACRALILSNYCHRDYSVEGRLPFEPYQTELLRIVAPLQAQFPSLAIRWRPHPADNRDAIARALAGLPSVERSPSAALEADLEWADVVVTTMSTTLLESLLTGVPLFIHVAPEYRDGHNGKRYDRSRTFFYAKDGVPKIAAVIADLSRGLVDDCRPEVQERINFFGPTGAPRSLGEVLREKGVLDAPGPHLA